MTLYHGSCKNIKNGILIPKQSFGDQPYVYATTDMLYALIRAGKFDIDNCLIAEDRIGDQIILCELEPGAFAKTFKRKGYVYTVDPNDGHLFKPTGNVDEFVSTVDVDICYKREFDNILNILVDVSTKTPYYLKLVTFENVEEQLNFWSTRRGGKEGYLTRRAERVAKLKSKLETPQIK